MHLRLRIPSFPPGALLRPVTKRPDRSPPFLVYGGVIGAVLMVTSLVAAAPPLAPPLGIPVTAERVELGHKLFFDARLSANGTISCATCHNPDSGWADKNPVAVGIFGRRGNRNTPSIINAAYEPLQFHDGRTIGIATQALQPIANRLEMGDQSEGQVINRLRNIPDYARLFTIAYGPKPNRQSSIDRNRFGHALAAFESTLISFDAPIDRRLAGDTRV